MNEPSRYWPDGRPVGGLNGYPEEYRAWDMECQARHVAKRLMQYHDRGRRRAEFDRWKRVMPGLDAERVKQLWLEAKTK